MRSSLVDALRNPIAAIGVALTTAAGLLFVFLVALQVVGLLDDAYSGLIVYVMVPALFTLGLLLIPVGLSIERRRVRQGKAAAAWPRLDLNDPDIRRTASFVVAATLINLVIISTATFGAVQYTESTAFCGQVCHDVMEPEFSAHQVGLHGQIGCVQCHVEPGAEGFIAAKVSGIRRLGLSLSGAHQRPIPTPIEGLPGVQNSCETCHQPDRFVGDVIKVLYEHADDAENTPFVTTLRLHVGGSLGGTSSGVGIHWHMNRANQVEYVALDDQREQIPYIRVSTPNGDVREFFAEGTTSGDFEGRPLRRMDCLDCHSRPAHTFAASPEREVDAAIGNGGISAGIPFIRREAVRALRGGYPTRELALLEIERRMREGVAAEAARPVNDPDLEQAIGVTQGIYRTNVFPGMNVGWGTYANQLGHTTSTGCFRCHDDRHTTPSGQALSQECELCHTFE